jgi:hypothetical protein
MYLSKKFRVVIGTLLIIVAVLVLLQISSLTRLIPTGQFLYPITLLQVPLFLGSLTVGLLFVLGTAAVEEGTDEFEEETDIEMEGEKEEPMEYYIKKVTDLGHFIDFLKKGGFNYKAIVADNRRQAFDAVLNMKYLPPWEKLSEIAGKLGFENVEDMMRKFGPGTKRLHIRHT